MLFVIVAFFAGLGLAVVETIFMSSIEIFGLRPDLVVLIVIVATCRLSFGRVMGLAFVLGLTRDFFSGGLVGMSSFSLIFTAYILLTAEDFLLTDNWRAQIFVAFVGALIFGIVFAFLRILVGFEITSPLRIVEIVGGTAAYTSVLSPLAFALSARPERSHYMGLKRKYDAEQEILHQAEI